MADFCKQCSIAVFGEDFGDMANLGEPVFGDDTIFVVLCEHCGPTHVKIDGTCVNPNCYEKHGDTRT